MVSASMCAEETAERSAAMTKGNGVKQSRLASWLASSVAFGLVILALSPWGSRCWWPAQTHFPTALFGMVYFLVLPSVWIGLSIKGLIVLGRRGLWLLIAAPLSLIPWGLTIVLLVNCVVFKDCR